MKERRRAAGPQLSMSLTVGMMAHEEGKVTVGRRKAVWQHESGIPVELPAALPAPRPTQALISAAKPGRFLFKCIAQPKR